MSTLSSNFDLLSYIVFDLFSYLHFDLFSYYGSMTFLHTNYVFRMWLGQYEYCHNHILGNMSIVLVLVAFTVYNGSAWYFDTPTQ